MIRSKVRFDSFGTVLFVQGKSPMTDEKDYFKKWGYLPRDQAKTLGLGPSPDSGVEVDGLDFDIIPFLENRIAERCETVTIKNCVLRGWDADQLAELSTKANMFVVIEKCTCLPEPKAPGWPLYTPVENSK